MFTLLSFAFCLIIFVYIKRPRLNQNEPPLVPYTIPVIGHTYDFLFNSDKFIRKCIKEYGEPFNIIVFGRVTTVVSQQYLPEVFRAHESFDVFEVLEEIFPMHVILNHDLDFNFHAKTVREQISGKLKYHIHNIQKNILYGIDKWIGESNGKVVWDIANHIVAKSTAHTCEASNYDDITHTFATLSDEIFKVFSIPPILSFIHPKLHGYFITLPFLIGFNPITKHKNILINRIKPVVEKRIQQKRELGDLYQPHDDLLEFYMSNPDFDSTNVDYQKLANLIAFMIIVGIITTGRSAVNLLYDYASRPEYWDELYEEALKIDKESNEELTVDDVDKMKKLDSFVRESLRHTSDIFVTPHAVVAKQYTFSNGYTIPKGRQVYDFSEGCLFSESQYGPDPKSFKPFQFLSQNVSATKIDKSYVIFGGGRHACPGRFYAVMTMKLFLHKIMLKYKVRTEEGGVAKKKMLGPLALPPKVPLVFERREKGI
ncbi:12958_t:CDS:10 [Funneliformis caledonium]|uniref:12958_t:CDS:1 n=1 Tax=Funneliformis caledonium TaxID=1117310 RepID=A0A9N8VBU0_9GLOM|nr:12958_t:CDS:10 [Funneliformis caledonium]